MLFNKRLDATYTLTLLACWFCFLVSIFSWGKYFLCHEPFSSALGDFVLSHEPPYYISIHGGPIRTREPPCPSECINFRQFLTVVLGFCLICRLLCICLKLICCLDVKRSSSWKCLFLNWHDACWNIYYGSDFWASVCNLQWQRTTIHLFVQVKEVIMAYFVLMSQGKATEQVSNKPSRLRGAVYLTMKLLRTT